MSRITPKKDGQILWRYAWHRSNTSIILLLFGLTLNNKSRNQNFCWVQYYEEMGKPTPKVEVMKYLKSKDYTDAKDYAGECESVVMIAKGQSTNTIFKL